MTVEQLSWLYCSFPFPELNFIVNIIQFFKYYYIYNFMCFKQLYLICELSVNSEAIWTAWIVQFKCIFTELSSLPWKFTLMHLHPATVLWVSSNTEVPKTL